MCMYVLCICIASIGYDLFFYVFNPDAFYLFNKIGTQVVHMPPFSPSRDVGIPFF